MAHFAELDENNTVIRVIVVANKDCGDLDFPDSEPIGQAFIAALGLNGVWKQTSYNNNFRIRYASIGYTYDKDLDAFIAPKPYPSWLLGPDTNWYAPTPMPTDGKPYIWNESTQSWDLVDVPQA